MDGFTRIQQTTSYPVIQMRMRKGFALSIAAIVTVTSACERSGTSSERLGPFTPGTYTLVRIGSEPLPAKEPCITGLVEAEQLTLRADRTAEWAHRRTYNPAGAQRADTARGYYDLTLDNKISLQLRHGALSPFGMTVERSAQGLTRTAGPICGEAAKVMVYRLR